MLVFLFNRLTWLGLEERLYARYKIFPVLVSFSQYIKGINAIYLPTQPDVYLCSINDVTVVPTSMRRARNRLFGGEVSPSIPFHLYCSESNLFFPIYYPFNSCSSFMRAGLQIHYLPHIRCFELICFSTLWNNSRDF